MNKILLTLLIIFLAHSCSVQKKSSQDYITIGTFNIAWLGDGIDDINPRNEAEYQAVADVIRNSKADILGLEEIENENSLKKITKYLTDYDFFVSSNGGSQNPAILFKKGIDINLIGDYMPLSVEYGKTRPGFLINVKSGKLDFVMMVVHFKSSSHYDSTELMQEDARAIRTKQAFILNKWIDSVNNISKATKFIIAGDFNDYPTRVNNATLIPLINNKNIEFLTYGMQSCKFEFMGSIDNIIISNSLKVNYLTNSVRMYDFNSSLPDYLAQKVSDHCPVLATFYVK